VSAGAPGADPRERVLEAAYASVARYGMAKTTVEDVAREAGLSRATLYRMFPGGRDELFAAMVGREMDRFFLRLAEAVADAPDFASVLEAALVRAHRDIRGHAVLQTVLATEPERLLPVMTAEENRIHEDVVAFLRPRLAAEAAAGRVRPGVDLDLATRYVASMGLSMMATPGRVDLEDPAAVRDLVRHELLGGILTAP
jgi:AcrR family transcriptional regulator